MDATELDLDAKLYKASDDLISELQVKLPLLIWHDGRERKRLRTHVPLAKGSELARILDRFQEWPQLLDPVLPSLIDFVVTGFTSCIAAQQQSYHYQPAQSARSAHTIPLATSLCHLLYSFCKVRGYKVIIRLLSSEPRYVEPMLVCFRYWNCIDKNDGGRSMGWQEKYIMLLWLSHLMLAPFQLSSMSSANNLQHDAVPQALTWDLPPVAQDVIALAMENSSSPGKERESAVILLVRLALRHDMQEVGLASRLVDHCIEELLQDTSPSTTVYHHLGHLALLYSIVDLATHIEVAPYLSKVFSIASRLSMAGDSRHHAIRDAAPARKLLIKILRVCLVHAIALTGSAGYDKEKVNSWLEDGIQHFLECVGDREFPVRITASKALSVITLKLDTAMAGEIVEAVLGGLSENLLLEDLATRRLMAKTELPSDIGTKFTRNLSAVDPLCWHGYMLTLGHLLFRRSPPSYQLVDIIEALLSGLEFEQRSNVGTSIGVGVRDAACFGIWSLARKYSTREVNDISAASIQELSAGENLESTSVIQVLATRLVIAACLDPSGNIRRGSSAALQELIGRHPDIVTQGIPLVQVIDYTAVARRSRAMNEVAIQAAGLGPEYRKALLSALIDWRGAKAADADSRRWAATAMRMLFISTPLSEKVALLIRLRDEVYRLGMRNLGSTARSRHGLLLCIAALIDSVLSSSTLHAELISSNLDSFDLTKLTGSIEDRATIDLEFAMEGICAFLESWAQLQSIVDTEFVSARSAYGAQLLPVIDRCILVCERPQAMEAASRAMAAVFPFLLPSDQSKLVSSWIDGKHQKYNTHVSKGRLKALAALHGVCADVTTQIKIRDFLRGLIAASVPVEVKVSAMEGLCKLLQESAVEGQEVWKENLDTLVVGLTDYTNDQRGDVGSLLRLQTLETIEVLDSLQYDHAQSSTFRDRLIPLVVKLAAERLTKVRHRAWLCLKKLRIDKHFGSSILTGYDHVEDVSTEEYYHDLLDLLSIEVLCRPLMLAICSAMAGTDEVNRACCAAIVSKVTKDGGSPSKDHIRTITEGILSQLQKVAQADDNEVLPVLDFLTFLLMADLVDQVHFQTKADQVWEVVRKIHNPTASMERVDSVMRLCDALSDYETLGIRAQDKLTRQLLHRYPKIRNAAADILYTSNAHEGLLHTDWNASATSNRSVVLELRKAMGVAKAASGAAS